MRTVRQESPQPLPAALLAAFLIALALLGAPSRALAGGEGQAIIQRCTHGESLSGFSQSAYTQALSELSATAEEYTSCSSLIRQAQLAAATGHGTSAGAGAVPTLIAATPLEQKAIAHAARAGSGPVIVGGRAIRPGVVPVNISSAVSTLPAPLLVLVVVVIAFIALIAAGGLRSHVRSRRTD